MPLKLRGPVHPAAWFDQVIDKIYKKSRGGGKKLSEPRYVRELISDKTIRKLNQIARRIYDPTQNAVLFRGGYLHARPYAKFTASWLGGGPVAAGSKTCRRELADALLVVYETSPVPGKTSHVVVRRTACMLMFKKENKAAPHTPNFKPGKDAITGTRGSSDKEQFYLFNKWPQFKLEDGTKRTTPLGEFDISGTQPHSVGKYALVWDGALPSKWHFASTAVTPRTTHWLYSDPLPGQPIAPSSSSPSTGSLGCLLHDMIDGIPQTGRGFTPTTAPATSPVGNWDDLMSLLLGYPPTAGSKSLPGHLAKGTYYGDSRDANPARMHLMTFTGPDLENIATDTGSFIQDVYQSRASMGEHNSAFFGEFLLDIAKNHFSYAQAGNALQNLRRRKAGGRKRRGRTTVQIEKRGLPILIASVSSFSPQDPPPEERRKVG